MHRHTFLTKLTFIFPLRRRQAERLGADFKIHYMDVPLDEICRRLEARNERVGQDAVFRVARADVEEWARCFEPPVAEELE